MLFAKLLVILYPRVEGIPRFVIASVNLPANVASASSLNGFNLSTKFSNCKAVSVPAPKSYKERAKEVAPFGISINPEPTPDNTE